MGHNFLDTHNIGSYLAPRPPWTKSLVTSAARRTILTATTIYLKAVSLRAHYPAPQHWIYYTKATRWRILLPGPVQPFALSICIFLCILLLYSWIMQCEPLAPGKRYNTVCAGIPVHFCGKLLHKNGKHCLGILYMLIIMLSTLNLILIVKTLVIFWFAHNKSPSAAGKPQKKFLH